MCSRAADFTGIMVPAAVMFAAAVVVATVAAPLLVYSVSLATFGAAHVLCELRYVDRRFGRSLDARRVGVMGFCLSGAVFARCAGLFGLMQPASAIALELSMVVALALTAAQGRAARRVLAVGVGAALGIATLASPFDTVISLSILHNLTPLAFLWEIAGRQSRAKSMLIAVIALIGVPLLVATGMPRAALMGLGIGTLAADPLGAGPLAQHLYVYVPRPLIAAASAIDLFSASVVAQCGHYAAVIVVLPAMLAARDPMANGLVPWPRAWIFAIGIVGISVLALCGYANDFVWSRTLYGIAASIHAWIEIPLIVIAMTRGAQANSTIPIAADAPLVIAETASDRATGNPAAQAMTAASISTTMASPVPSAGQ
jgi:hypothetical protein